MNDNIYWAADNTDPNDEKKLVGVLEEKTNLYQRQLRSGPQWRRLIRNLRYYHGNFYPWTADAISFELRTLDSGHVGIGVNHYRNILDQILLIATGDRISFKCRAINTDNESLQEARLGNGLLDYYVKECNLQGFTKSAAQHALVLNAGFTLCTWDGAKGKLVDQDPTTGEQFMQGDFTFDNPSICDVAFDMTVREWKKVQWVIVRTQVNRWDLIAKYPHRAEEICRDTADRAKDLFYYQGQSITSSPDIIFVYQFFHKACDAMPKGRHTVYVPGAVLLDEVNPYEGIPLFRCVHGEFLFNCLGYSVANDLQSLQEAENGAISAITTSLSAHGVGHIWMKPGDRLTAKNFEGGLRALVSENQPVPINFTAISPDTWKAADLYVRAMEYLSGVNSTRRGQPEASLRTGKALQIIAAQAIEASSSFSESYRQMTEELATHMVRCLMKYGRGERLVSIVGRNNLPSLETIDTQNLSKIDRVMVESVNPLTGTLFGRIAVADDLADKQLVKNLREYMALQTSGTIEPLLEFEQSSLNLVHEENELLRQGMGVLASELHPHVLHVKEHSTILSNLKNAADDPIRNAVIAHIMDHIRLWTSPDQTVQALQAALSGEPPPFVIAPPGMMGPGGPGGPPPPGGQPPPPGGGPPGAPANQPPDVSGSATTAPAPIPGQEGQ